MNKKDLLFTIGCLLIVVTIMIFGIYVVDSRENNQMKIEKDFETGLGPFVNNIDKEDRQVTLRPYSFWKYIDNLYGLEEHDLSEIKEYEFNAEFVSEDIDLRNKKLKFTVLNPDLYNVNGVEQLKIGDKITVNEREVLIESIEFTDYLVEINGGFDGSENGVSLAPENVDSYKSVIFNDLNTFTVIGETEYSISENMVIYDYMHGDYGEEPTVIEFDDIENYINGLSDVLKEFGRTSTLVKVENNEVISITRVWRP